MPYRDTRAAREAIQEVALLQGGYFTALQAKAAGYGRGHLAYHVRVGNFEHVAWGVYRLPGLPLSEHDDLIRWSLWSRNRAGEPQAVIGHESALAVHELGDLIPACVHMVVPPGFRKAAPRACSLHFANLELEDTEEHEGYRITTPLRTLLDLAGREDFARKALLQAIDEARVAGLVRDRELRKRAAQEGVLERMGVAGSSRSKKRT